MERDTSEKEHMLLILWSCQSYVEKLLDIVKEKKSWYYNIQCFKEDNSNEMKIVLENIRQCVQYMPQRYQTLRRFVEKNCDDISRKLYEGLDENKMKIKAVCQQLHAFLEKQANIFNTSHLNYELYLQECQPKFKC
jgi:uncharacterized protein Yka (UPF0111/DUF47 family)